MIYPVTRFARLDIHQLSAEEAWVKKFYQKIMKLVNVLFKKKLKGAELYYLQNERNWKEEQSSVLFPR